MVCNSHLKFYNRFPWISTKCRLKGTAWPLQVLPNLAVLWLGRKDCCPPCSFPHIKWLKNWNIVYTYGKYIAEVFAREEMWMTCQDKGLSEFLHCPRCWLSTVPSRPYWQCVTEMDRPLLRERHSAIYGPRAATGPLFRGTVRGTCPRPSKLCRHAY